MTDLNEQQLARLARLNKRNPAPEAVAVASAVTVAAAPVEVSATELNEQQLARLARLGNRNPSAARPATAALPVPAPASTT
ncbi:MAG TPA: hypothetical protein VIH06_03245, partial [Ilumatobacteraceae bacterium]